MVKTRLFQLAGLLGLVAMAACSTGPLDVCVPDAENPNQVNCPAPPEAAASDEAPIAIPFQDQ